jgi:hypothetical protein
MGATSNFVAAKLTAVASTLGEKKANSQGKVERFFLVAIAPALQKSGIRFS